MAKKMIKFTTQKILKLSVKKGKFQNLFLIMLELYFLSKI